jgi:predicted peroxiredoxin
MAESRAPFDRDAVIWRTPEGGVVSCVEKIKVMSQNFRELRQLAKDTLEDAILMGCDEAQVRAKLVRLMESIESEYKAPRA